MFVCAYICSSSTRTSSIEKGLLGAGPVTSGGTIEAKPGLITADCMHSFDRRPSMVDDDVSDGQT